MTHPGPGSTIGGVPFEEHNMTQAESIASIYDCDPRLVEVLDRAADEWGALGVAKIAAQRTDLGALIASIRDQPRLGIATTGELLAEVATRMEVRQNSLKGRELGDLCREALDHLDAGVLNYATWQPRPESGDAGDGQ